MVDLYQTGIIITFILIIAGSMFGVLSRIDSEDDGIDLSIPSAFNSIYTDENSESNIQLMISSINQDFNSAASSSNLISQSILFGAALVNGAIAMFNIIVAAFTSWYAIVDILFAFTADTAIYVLRDVIKIILSLVIIYTILKFLGDLIAHLPFFGG